jgi:hypothetical protein
MGEWLKPAVLKTVDGETRPGVRIPLPPPPTTFINLATIRVVKAMLGPYASAEQEELLVLLQGLDERA